MDFSSIFYGLDMQILLYLFAICNSSLASTPSAALYVPSDGNRESDNVIVPNVFLDNLESVNISIDEMTQRENWLSSHVSSGIEVVSAMEDSVNSLDSTALRYKAEIGKCNSKKSMFKTKKLTINEYELLRDYCRKLINMQVDRVNRGNVEAIPVGENICGYCDYNSICGGFEKYKIVNKMCMERVIKRNGSQLDK